MILVLCNVLRYSLRFNKPERQEQKNSNTLLSTNHRSADQALGTQMKFSHLLAAVAR